MWADNLYAAAMRHAATQCGGEEDLARHLGVPADDVRRWTVGEGLPPPPGKVLIALFLSVTKSRASGNLAIAGRDKKGEVRFTVLSGVIEVRHAGGRHDSR